MPDRSPRAPGSHTPCAVAAFLEQSAWGRRIVPAPWLGSWHATRDGGPAREPVALPGPATVTGVLPPEVVRTMVWSRLRALAGEIRGPSAVVWRAFARQWNLSYTPVVPWPGGQGTTPLGHAARSCAGHGLAWRRLPSGWQQAPADQVLRGLRVDPVPRDPVFVREFVRGDEAELACALHHHLRLRSLTETVTECCARLRPLVVRDPPSDPPVMSAEARLQVPYALWPAQRELSALLDEVIRQGDLLVHEAECRTEHRARAIVRASEFQVRGAGMLAFFAMQQLRPALRARDHGGRSSQGRRPDRGPGGDDDVIAAAGARLAAIRSLRQEGAHGSSSITHALEALDHARWTTTALCTALAGQPGTGCGGDPPALGGAWTPPA
ncbi:aromatic amino acid lyase [Streptomyces sp. NPDC006314]|uniref:aromatic amino acid lyase n=1 Tax=Streptomyces sp. NPDC006314 TaxID=3154475 RepID=UPI0033BCDC85